MLIKKELFFRKDKICRINWRTSFIRRNNKYKKILIIEPYFGNVLERRIKKKIKEKIYISTVSYEETIIHKYGNKIA